METTYDNFFEERFAAICTELDQSGAVGSLSKEFSQLKSDQARVKHVLGLPAVNTLLQLPPLKEQKSSSKATQLRNTGNKCFAQKRYSDAIVLYTQSIAASALPVDGAGKNANGNELALALANRSAAAFHMSEYNACLADIALALKHDYPEKMAYKLYDRRGKCYCALEQPDSAMASIQEGIRCLDVADLDTKKTAAWHKDFTAQLQRCVGMDNMRNSTKSDDVKDATNDDKHKPTPCVSDGHKNTTFTSLSDHCEVVFSPECGRYLVAKCDIKPGEIILVEKPYASVLLPEYRWSHCQHCMSRTISVVPCLHCSAALYCCEACRDEAWATYHRAECRCLDLIFSSGVGKFGHLALRTVAMETLAWRMEYKQKLDAGEYDGVPDILKGCNDNGKYVADDYNAIYRLVTHSQDRAVHDLFRRSVMAVFLTRCLQRCGYFDENKTTGDPEVDVTYIGGLILSHLQLLPCNAHEISELQLDRNAVATSVSVEIGAGIYSTLSLFNHSCDPAVVRHMYAQTCVSRAIKTIYAGEEVADNYGTHFALQVKAERQEKLNSQYFFTCGCVACREDWPMYVSETPSTPVWKCQHCRKPMKRGESTGIVTCRDCNSRRSVSDCIKTLTHINADYQKAFDDLLGCKVDLAQPALLRHLEVLDELVCLPWRDYSSCQEAIKQCFSILSNCHNLSAK